MFDSLPPLPFERESKAATPEELSGLVKYLHQVIAEYGAGAADLGLILDREGIEEVLTRLKFVVEGTEWVLDDSADTRNFFLHGLYFELNERRGSILEKVAGRTKPISDEVWLQLLDEVRRGMQF